MDTPCFGASAATLGSSAFTLSETLHAPRTRTPAHRHEVMLLHYVLSGVYEEDVPGRTVRLGPGEVLFKPIGIQHSNDFRLGGSSTLRIELRPDSLHALTNRLPFRTEVLKSPHLDLLARRAHRELTAPDDLSASVASSLALELFAAIARTPQSGEASGTKLARTCAAILDQEFAASPSLSTVAPRLGVSRTRLAHTFRREFGCSVGDYVRKRRVAYVAERMRTEPWVELSTLSQEAGFADQSHMTRTFKAVYGKPPGAWRRMNGRTD